MCKVHTVSKIQQMIFSGNHEMALLINSAHDKCSKVY